MRTVLFLYFLVVAATIGLASAHNTTYFWTYSNVQPSYTEHGVPIMAILSSDAPNKFPGPNVDRLLGSAVFEETIMEKGWNSFTASPNRTTIRKDPSIAWYTAGFAEGYLMMYQINQTMHATTNTNNYTSGAMAFIRQQADYMLRTSYARRKESPFWEQIHKQMLMIHGIVDGYKLRQSETLFDFDHTFEHAMMNNLFPEYDDILGAVRAQGYDGNGSYPVYDPTKAVSRTDSNKHGRLRSIDPENEHCSALIKVTASDVFFGHNTWFRYSYYPGRVHKTYVMETAVTMSGNAGRIHSCDDWYQTSNLLGVMETSNMFTNDELFMKIHPHSVAEFMRVMAANYLATNGRDWVKLFGTNNSGTYCNQWMVVDYKLYAKGMSHKDLPKDFFWIAEEMPGLVVSRDMTDFLRENGFWASYNIPYFPEIYKIAGFQQEAAHYGSFFKWGESPRAKILRRDHHKVTDLASMQKIMRYNDWVNDELSAIPNCTGCAPKNSPANAISSRYDLVPKNATYGNLPPEFARFFRNGYFGALDAKVTSYDLITSNFSVSFQQGPTHDNFPPFEWPADAATGKLPGMPQKFDFAWYEFSPKQNIAIPSPKPAARDQYVSIVTDVFRVPSNSPINTFDENGVPIIDVFVGIRGTYDSNATARAGYVPLATAAYNLSGRATGWDMLTVTGDQTALYASDEIAYQAWYAAGIAEGYATSEAIENVVVGHNFTTYSHADAFVAQHIRHIRSRYMTVSTPFYKQIRKMMIQMEGMVVGANLRNAHMNRTNARKITFFDIFMLNFANEYDDVSAATAPTDEAREAIIKARRVEYGDKCSVLIKIVEDDYIAGHLTWAPFKILIHKQHKSYVMDGTLTLTTNAGGITSGDDWYQTPNGLLVQETTNEFYNDSLYSLIKPQSVSEFLRAAAASYLAKTSDEWAKLYSQEPSGTYCNQWMIFDDKLYTKGMPAADLKPNTFWVIEEIPGNVTSADMTATLRKNGYWVSYNVPFFPYIYRVSGFADKFAKDGDYYSYEKTARAQIFRREVHRVKDVDSMMLMLRFNKFQDDYASVIPNCPECSPSHSPGLSISSRFDLVDPNFHAAGYAKIFARGVWGGSDVKVSSSSLFRDGYKSVNWAGPTNDNQPTFHWDDNENDASYGRAGLVQFYNFTKEVIAPSGNIRQSSLTAARSDQYYVYNASAVATGTPVSPVVSETLLKLVGGRNVSLAGSTVYLGSRGLLATVALNHSSDVIGWEQITVAPNKALFESASDAPAASPQADDDLLAWYAAGVAEGYSSLQSIKNVVAALSTDFSEKAKPFVAEHHRYMVDNSILKGSRDSKVNGTIATYWRQVRKQLLQMEGIAVGFNLRARELGDAQRYTFDDIFQLNLNCEVGDIEGAVKSQRARDVSLDPERCSALIKATDEDIFFSHVTWSGLDFLVGRQYKTYAMEVSVSLTGSAGIIASGDDFQISSNGIAAQETTTAFYNASLFAFIKPQTVSQFMRGVLASYLAKTAQEWTELFKIEHSGTYCNQWQALDYNKYKKGTPFRDLPDGILWIVEELPGLTGSGDMTWYLRSNGIWPSFNIPYFAVIYETSGFANHSKTYGTYYSWLENPRHQMYRRDAPKITNLTSMMRMMRYNNYAKDDYSMIPNCPSCTPRHNPKIAVAARGDLGSKDFDAGVWADTPYGRSFRRSPFGSCDAKITSSDLMSRFASVSEAGPTHDDQPVFSWYDYPEWPQGQLNGMIQTWNFKWQELRALSTDEPKDDDKSNNNLRIIIGAVVGGAVFLAIAAAIAYAFKKRKAAAAAASPDAAGGARADAYQQALNQESGV